LCAIQLSQAEVSQRLARVAFCDLLKQLARFFKLLKMGQEVGVFKHSIGGGPLVDSEIISLGLRNRTVNSSTVAVN